MQIRKGSGPARGSGRRNGFGDDLAGQGALDGAQQPEGVEWLHQPAVGLGLSGEPDVDLTIEQQQHGPLLQATVAFFVAHGQAGGHATHVADLEIEQDDVGVDLADRRYHVGAGAHPMHRVGTGHGGLDLVEDRVGVGGEEDVRHGRRCYTGVVDRYDARVLEIHVSRPDDRDDATDHVELRPEGELDAYSVAQFRETFDELSGEMRLIVDLSAVQFMDSAGLGALIGGIRKVRENDGRITVLSSVASITRLLHTTGFDRIVPVEEQRGEAISALDRDPDA